LRKTTSKIQGSFCPTFSFTEFYKILKFFLSDLFPFDAGKMDLKSNPFQERGNDAPWIVDPSQDDATMVELESNLEKEGLSEWMQPRGCNSVDATLWMEPLDASLWMPHLWKELR